MNVADRFKPVSQIEVKRTVEVGESVGKLQVSAPESHLEVVKQVPQAGSLEDLIAMDVRDEESARKAKEAKDEESAARKAKKRFEEEEAKRAEEAREKELQRKREEEAKARKAEKAERAAAEQRLKEEAEKKEAERREAEKIERAQQHQQVEAAAENGDHAALLLAKQKALELAQQWLAEEENRHAKTTAALQASEKEKSAAVAEAKREREQREHAEAEGRKASQQLAEMGTEMANHVAELEREIARLKAEVATQKTEISKLSGELASAKAAPPPAAAVAAASASEIPKFSSWKEFFVLAGLPEEAASEYATLFEDAAIELSQAVDLTKDELAELEVPMGHRMKILKLIKQPQKE
jgi:DNA repair exonuclease SbcCD ATPase subunit